MDLNELYLGPKLEIDVSTAHIIMRTFITTLILTNIFFLFTYELNIFEMLTIRYHCILFSSLFEFSNLCTLSLDSNEYVTISNNTVWNLNFYLYMSFIVFLIYWYSCCRLLFIYWIDWQSMIFNHNLFTIIILIYISMITMQILTLCFYHINDIAVQVCRNTHFDFRWHDLLRVHGKIRNIFIAMILMSSYCINRSMLYHPKLSYHIHPRYLIRCHVIV
jgi:hypothetical protein